MTQEELEIAIYESRFSKKAIAEEIGIKSDTLHHWFYRGINPLREQLILRAIERLKEKRTKTDGGKKNVQT